MQWKHEEWSIQKLVKLYEDEKINLSPEYQRNPIWTSKAQKILIDTILAPQPMPNFFLRYLANEKYEMVDGQQRARTIIGFLRGYITSSDGLSFDKLKKEDSDAVLEYPLNITLLTELEKDESIEMFYYLVNSSGLRLNTPEIRKAKYHETRFLALAQSLAASPAFSSLELFSHATVRRMNDVELVSELLALLKHGICEKKVNVERLYEKDIDEEEEHELRLAFDHVVGVLCSYNDVYPLSKTRYKQRADLYTVFDFINRHNNISTDAFSYYYNVLLAIAPHIRPSQEKCDPLREYAINCVSQSNSESARKERSQFFNELLRNSSSTANETQQSIIHYLNLQHDLVKVAGAWTISCSDISMQDS